ncbi:hypothetical protein NC652_006942 [Populus alba x Populus x berolinensis]|uniref:Uncharacterized protein n=1 Tax=Populus alba x Populus x berolinensis TaxID=444605 RepID=A0AAD6WEX8_9ROSI|nr:hypothetical protein NC652_006942 [Populus alba x Populus x berolinensis]KAJ7007974.1 hypothetical protein NC653_006877 [Populus alba x Populus x berolinensis]
MDDEYGIQYASFFTRSSSSQPITFCSELWLCLWSRLLSFRRYNYCLHGWFLKVPFMVCALPTNLLLVL